MYLKSNHRIKKTLNKKSLTQNISARKPSRPERGLDKLRDGEPPVGISPVADNPEPAGVEGVECERDAAAEVVRQVAGDGQGRQGAEGPDGANERAPPFLAAEVVLPIE